MLLTQPPRHAPSWLIFDVRQKGTMPLAIAAKIWGVFISIFPVAERIVSERFTFRARIYALGYPRPGVAITLINHTKDTALFITGVRAHYGRPERSYFLKFSPEDTVNIPPKGRVCFTLHDDCKVGRVTITEHEPDMSVDTPPSFESNMDLVRTIGIANPKDSWIEVVSNEFRGRRFLLGKIAPVFRVAYKTYQKKK
jgi:hypothetical protein